MTDTDETAALRFWKWAYALNVAAAKLALRARRAEQRLAGETHLWPGEQDWNNLVSTSHAVFLREARELAGINHDEFLAVVRGTDTFAWAADAIYMAAAQLDCRSPVEAPGEITDVSRSDPS